MSEVKKCPKCSGKMAPGGLRMGVPGGLAVLKPGQYILPDRIYLMFCEDCGYIELYKEMKGKKK